MCQHTCRNTWGSFQCLCNEGYELAGDGRTCDGQTVYFLITTTTTTTTTTLCLGQVTHCIHCNNSGKVFRFNRILDKCSSSSNSSSSSSSSCWFQILFNQPIFRRSLQVRPGPHRSCKEEPLGISGVRFFTGRMPVLSLSQQCQCTDGVSLVPRLIFFQIRAG